jgi:hypothetical protein
LLFKYVWRARPAPGCQALAPSIGGFTGITLLQAVRAYIHGAGECKKGLAKAITDP